jgi:hypothetical protein
MTRDCGEKSRNGISPVAAAGQRAVRWTWAPRFRLSPPPSRKPKSWSATGAARAPRLARLFPCAPRLAPLPLSRVAYRKAEEWGPSTSRRRPSPPRPHARAPPPGGLRGASEVAHEPQGHGRRREPRIPPLLLQLQLEPGRQWEQGQAPGPQQWRPCAVAGKAPAVRQEGGRRERDVPGVQPEHDRPHGVRADQVDVRPAQGWLGPAMAPQPLPRARARASGGRGRARRCECASVGVVDIRPSPAWRSHGMGRHAHAGPGGALTRWDGLRGSLLSGRSHRGGLPCVLRQGRRAAADRAPWAGEATPIRTTNHQPPTTIEPSDPRRHDSPAARSSPDAPSSLCLPLAYPASCCMPRSQAEQRQQIDASTVGLQDVDLSAHENAMRGECLFASLAEAHALSHCAADQPPQRNSAMWAAACSLYEEVHGVLPTVDAMGLPMGPPTVAELRAVVASQFDENTWNTIRDSGLLEEDRYSYVADTVHSTRINIATDSVRGGAVGYWGDEMALAVLCRYLHLEPYVCAFEAADVCTRYSTPCRPDSAGDEADRRCVILSHSSSENSAGDHFHLLGQCSPEWPCGRTLVDAPSSASRNFLHLSEMCSTKPWRRKSPGGRLGLTKSLMTCPATHVRKQMPTKQTTTVAEEQPVLARRRSRST